MKNLFISFAIALLMQGSNVFGQGGFMNTGNKSKSTATSLGNVKDIRAGISFSADLFFSNFGGDSYIGNSYTLGVPVDYNLKKYLGFSVRPSFYFTSSSESTNDYRYKISGFCVPIAGKINLKGKYLDTKEFSILAGIKPNFILTARDELGSDLLKPYGYGYYSQKSGIGTILGFQFGTLNGSFLLAYETTGIKEYAAVSRGFSYGAPLKEGILRANYTYYFGSKKRVQQVNEVRVSEGLEPISEKRRLF